VPARPGLDALLRTQAQNNRNADKHADSFAGHRAALTAAILARAPATGAGRLALLGAGNAHDVDLPALGDRYAELHLIDLDAAALARARARQPAALQSRLFLHAPVDLGGMAEALLRWRAAKPTAAELGARVDAAVEEIRAALPEAPFDVTASCCLATQLSYGVTAGLGDAHPALAEVRRAVVTVHLRALAALTRPGGQAVFVSDLVSDQTYPLDALAGDPEADLAAVQAEVTRAGNFFFGADPLLHAQVLRRDPVLAAAIEPPEPLRPWLWQNGPHRLFLVHGWTARRREAPGRGGDPR
jgi:SAM-dependent methyltransferase